MKSNKSGIIMLAICVISVIATFIIITLYV